MESAIRIRQRRFRRRRRENPRRNTETLLRREQIIFYRRLFTCRTFRIVGNVSYGQIFGCRNCVPVDVVSGLYGLYEDAWDQNRYSISQPRRQGRKNPQSRYGDSRRQNSRSLFPALRTRCKMRSWMEQRKSLQRCRRTHGKGVFVGDQELISGCDLRG